MPQRRKQPKPKPKPKASVQVALRRRKQPKPKPKNLVGLRRRCIGKQPEQFADLNDLEGAVDFFFPELRGALDAPDVELEDMILASADLSGADSDAELPVPPCEPLDEIVSRMVDQLPLDDYVSLCKRWRSLHALSQTYTNGKIPVGSGCSGSGMDVHVLMTLSRIMLSRTGIDVQWSSAFVCEFDPNKRRWLEWFGKPGVIAEDVTEIADSPLSPDHLFLYTFGYSCKDFSSLNNQSKGWVDTCLTDRRGTTGTTWGGNVSYLPKCKPAFIMIENVKASMKGDNYRRMQLDLAKAGYVVEGMIVNTERFGLPQHRERAYFIAVREDLHRRDPGWQTRLHDCVACLELEVPLPLERFLLSDDHPYVMDTLERSRQARVVKLTCFCCLSF